MLEMNHERDRIRRALSIVVTSFVSNRAQKSVVGKYVVGKDCLEGYG